MVSSCPFLTEHPCIKTLARAAQEAELPAGFAMQMRPKVEVFNFARSPEPEPEAGAPPAADNEQVYTAMPGYLIWVSLLMCTHHKFDGVPKVSLT